MIEIKDIETFRIKFSKLLSNAFHEAHISVDSINQALTYGNYFDFLESDDLSYFTDRDIDVSLRNIFGNTHAYERVDDRGELYWAGEQYVSIFLNTCFPLKTIFLLLPLYEMVSLFDKYHEMNKTQIIAYFNETMMKRSILKLLRKEKGFTVKELSILTNIPEQTIKYYESSRIRNLY